MYYNTMLTNISKLNEIQNLINGFEPKADTVELLIKKHFKELTGFKQLYGIKKLDEKKRKKEKLYIRYINAINNKFNYGGFLMNYNDQYLTLINKNKIPWRVEFDRNFIFYNRVLTENEKRRANFEEFLKQNN